MRFTVGPLVQQGSRERDYTSRCRREPGNRIHVMDITFFGEGLDQIRRKENTSYETNRHFNPCAHHRRCKRRILSRNSQAVR